MVFTKDDILSDLIHDNYKLLKVIDRFGIKLGLRNQSIKSICTASNLNPDLLCLIINMFCDQNYKIANPTHYEYIPQLLEYLEASHDYFLEDIIPEIQTEISKLVYNIEEPNASLIKNFFDNYIREVNEHMGHENKIVFNYISALYNAYHNKTSFALYNKFSILEYEKNHEDIEQVLMDLKNLLLKHLPNKDLKDNRINVLMMLFELEYELHRHQQIEDKLLVKLVKGLENDFLKSTLHAK